MPPPSGRPGLVLCCSVAVCPHDSVEVRLRPPGIDLWTSRHASAGETALLLLLLGAVVLHRLPQFLLLAGADPLLLHSSSKAAACGLAVLALSLPGALVWGAHTAAIASGSHAGRSSLGSSDGASSAAQPASFLDFYLAYVSGGAFPVGVHSGVRGLGPGHTTMGPPPFAHPTADCRVAHLRHMLPTVQVPLVWAATLAYHGQFFLTEAGLVGQVRGGTVDLQAHHA